MLSHPDLQLGEQRAQNWHTIVRPALEEWAKDKTKEEVTQILLGLDLSVGPVQNGKDLYECPQLRARNMIIAAEDPLLGKVEFAGNPVKMSATPEPPPKLDARVGVCTEQGLSSLLGLTQDEIRELHAAGVV
jgi:crotonobetainyl-CoA:carnitine CoA-transferase CaiB-like acyl-CoA transferase